MKVAGIDVHKKVLMVVLVDASTPEEKPVRRRFVTMPSELHRLLLWLREQGVEEAVMESTAQYWRSVWLELEPHMRLHLAQAFSNRAPRGRKHDFKDAERLVRTRWTQPIPKESFTETDQASRDLDGEGENEVSFQRTVADLLLQCHPVEILHDDEWSTVLPPDLMDRADIGMVECRSRLRLALEASQGLRITNNFFRQEFQSDEAVQGQVFSLVDHTHSASADLLDDAVVRDGFGRSRASLQLSAHVCSMSVMLVTQA